MHLPKGRLKREKKTFYSRKIILVGSGYFIKTQPYKAQLIAYMQFTNTHLEIKKKLHIAH